MVSLQLGPVHWNGAEMLGAALYYPHIDIEDPVWLRSAVLFWDSLQTIAPRSVKCPYTNQDTVMLWQEGFLEPLRCDLHPELIDTLGRRVIALMNGGVIGSRKQLSLAKDPNAGTLLHGEKIGIAMNEELARSLISRNKLSAALADQLDEGINPAKLPPALQDYLEYSILSRSDPGLTEEMFSNRLRDVNGEWLLVNSRFADTYMSALAALLAKEADMPALTNKERSMSVNLHTFLEDVKPSEPSEKKGALVSFVMESMLVDPETGIGKLLAFRRSRTDQFAELTAQFNDLSSKILTCETGRELGERVRETYGTRIRPKLETLKDELRDNSIQCLWDGIQRAVTISVPAGGTLAYFSGLSGTTLLAAGAAITVTDLAVKTHLARRKARRASPYTYLLDVQQRFSVSP